MSEYLIKEESLVALADAIREKAGSADSMTLAQMAEAILGIQAGGGDVQIKTGTFQVAEYTDVTAPNYYAVSHGLGVVPDLIVVLPDTHYPSTSTGTFVGLVMHRFEETSAYRKLIVYEKKSSAGFVGEGNNGVPTATTLYVGAIGSTATTNLPSGYGFRWWVIAWKREG